MKKICIIVSTPMTVKAFLLKHIEELSKNYEVTVVSNSVLDLPKEYKAKIFSKEIPIERKINLISDLKSIWLLCRFLKKEKFDLVLSVTPKAGLVTSISAYLAGVPNRMHFFTGQVWVTKKGLFRFLLKSIDKLIATLNTCNFIDSPSQKEFLIRENILCEQKAIVLLSGSISGVDIKKFHYNDKLRGQLQKKYKIHNSDIVFMFIGRLNIDKGILDLSTVFESLLEKYTNIKLFLIGPDEEDIERKISHLLEHPSVIRVDYVSDPQEILNVADILVLPSYREGFGTIVIEAASMGIPCIASNIYGLKDAVIDGYTGLLHNVRDSKDMISKYEYVLKDRGKIKEYGENAKKRVYIEFQDEFLSKELKKKIERLVE